jgi:hypothetical protein
MFIEIGGTAFLLMGGTAILLFLKYGYKAQDSHQAFLFGLARPLLKALAYLAIGVGLHKVMSLSGIPPLVEILVAGGVSSFFLGYLGIHQGIGLRATARPRWQANLLVIASTFPVWLAGIPSGFLVCTLYGVSPIASDLLFGLGLVAFTLGIVGIRLGLEFHEVGQARRGNAFVNSAMLFVALAGIPFGYLACIQNL